MKTHLTEYEIDLLITSSESISDAGMKIYRYTLKNVNFVKSICEAAQEFYDELKIRFKKEPKTYDETLTNRISKNKSALQLSFLSSERRLQYSKKLSGEVIKFKEVNPGVIPKVHNIIKHYPLQSWGGMV